MPNDVLNAVIWPCRHARGCRSRLPSFDDFPERVRREDGVGRSGAHGKPIGIAGDEIVRPSLVGERQKRHLMRIAAWRTSSRVLHGHRLRVGEKGFEERLLLQKGQPKFRIVQDADVLEPVALIGGQKQVQTMLRRYSQIFRLFKHV